MDLGNAMCEALVDGWHGDWKMWRVVSHAWKLCDQTPENETEKYLAAASAIKVNYINAQDRAQVWIPKKLPQLNEALWAARKRETCIAIAAKSIGKRVGGELMFGARVQDKRSDWRTVK